MDFNAAKDALLPVLLSAIGVYIAGQMKELVKSVQELNVKVAEVVERVASHKETLEEHAQRINRLESRD